MKEIIFTMIISLCLAGLLMYGIEREAARQSCLSYDKGLARTVADYECLYINGFID